MNRRRRALARILREVQNRPDRLRFLAARKKKREEQVALFIAIQEMNYGGSWAGGWQR